MDEKWDIQENNNFRLNVKRCKYSRISLAIFFLHCLSIAVNNLLFTNNINNGKLNIQ